MEAREPKTNRLYVETGAGFVTVVQRPQADGAGGARLQVYGEETRMRRALHGLLTLLAVLAVALTATRNLQAEPQRGGRSTLAGVVLGPDDNPVPHAAVTYQSSGGNAPHAVHTDARGRFRITKLAADNYDVRASGRGVFSEWEKNVTLHRGQTREITLRLIYAKKIPKAYVKKKPQ